MKIHVLSLNRLIRTLKTRELGQKEQMFYYLASTLVIYFGTQYSIWMGPSAGWLFWFELLVLIVIAVYGCRYCWKCNQGDAGKDFILRILCLSVPIGIWLLVLNIALGQLLLRFFESVFMDGTFSDPYRAFVLVGYAMFVGMIILYWYLLGYGLKKINRQQTSTSDQ